MQNRELFFFLLLTFSPAENILDFKDEIFYKRANSLRFRNKYCFRENVKVFRTDICLMVTKTVSCFVIFFVF